MAFFGADDVAGSGLTLALVVSPNREDEQQLAEAVVMSALYRRRLNQCLLDTLLVRSIGLFKHV
jgi:hypothetical protein